MSKHVFGPVPSRRLGFSLGVDTIPPKYCSFDCIYCQIGKTTCLEVERRRFFDVDEVASDVAKAVHEAKRVDFVTFSGSGEPTLNSDLGLMIREVKKRVQVPVAVITNGSLLFKGEVRNDLMEADVVLPSLDAVSEDIFHYINRPHPFIDLDMMIKGLKDFRDEYPGRIWLEVMMMRDVNDDPEELAKLKDVIGYIGVDKVQLNTVTRPPSMEIRGTMETQGLERVRGYLGERCEIVCAFEKAVEHGEEGDAWEEMILDILERRSMNLEDIVRITGMPYLKIKSRLSLLEHSGAIESFHFGDDVFYIKPHHEG